MGESSTRASIVRSSSKLRYPLRSAIKSNEEKVSTAELPNCASKRGRPAASVSKSVGLLELSGKDKPAKPPRRLSIPTKSTPSSVPRSFGAVTPISEVIVKRPTNSRAKIDTPIYDVTRSSTRKKFSALSSALYWLSQIKLSESAANHRISLGLFKLALEAGCEPLQKMRDELKSYTRRHNLTELGEPAKELLEGYNISENFEQVQVSEACSQVPEEETHSSDDDLRSSSSVTGTRKPKQNSLNTTAVTQTSSVTESAKETTQKAKKGTRSQGPINKNSTSNKSSLETTGHSISKKFQKPKKQESYNLKDNIKKHVKKVAPEEANPAATCRQLQENKENMDAPQVTEISLAEA